MVGGVVGDTGGWQARGGNGWAPWRISVLNCPVHLVIDTVMIENIMEGMLNYDLICSSHHRIINCNRVIRPMHEYT